MILGIAVSGGSGCVAGADGRADSLADLGCLTEVEGLRIKGAVLGVVAGFPMGPVGFRGDGKLGANERPGSLDAFTAVDGLRGFGGFCNFAAGLCVTVEGVSMT